MNVSSMIVCFLKNLYQSQRLFINWGKYISEHFFVENGIRQGSILSPYLFDVYVDELNFLLAKAGVGCYISGKSANNFSYSDDLALMAPTARALNQVIVICLYDVKTSNETSLKIE